MLYYTLWLPVVVSIGFLLGHLKFDRGSTAIVLAGLGLCYFYLYHSTAEEFPIDIDAHKAYIAYIDTHHALPERSQEGVMASHHLPLYYLLATGLYELAKYTDTVDPFEVARHLSVMLYGLYLVLAALIFRKTIRDAHVRRLALAMAVFWPIGVVMASRLHVDLLSYVGQVGVIYSMICWGSDKKNNALSNAFLFAGVLLLARNFGMFFMMVLIACVAIAAYENRKNLRAVFTPRMLASIGFAVACYVISWLHREMFPDTEFSAQRGLYSWADYAEVFLYYNPWHFITETTLSPTEGDNRLYFWHYLQRTAILGDFIGWKAWPLLFGLGVVWQSVIVYLLYGVVRNIKRLQAPEGRQLLVIGVFAGMMVGMLLCARYIYMFMVAVGDARYIFPITVLLTILFAKSIEWHRAAGREITAQIGQGLALGFVLLSASIIIAQHLKF